jgi:prepilin-type processing-associated H-X9-DG protein
MLLAVVEVFLPMFDQFRAHNEPTCMANEKQLILGLLAYAQDYGERFPNALTWAQVLPLTDDAVLTCTRDKRRQVLSYDMLQRWSGQKPLGEGAAASAIFLYEIGPRGLEYRHNSGMNIAYMDGHVKWREGSYLRPALILSGLDPIVAERVKEQAEEEKKENQAGR